MASEQVCITAGEGRVGESYRTESGNEVTLVNVGKTTARLRSKRFGHCVEVPLDLELFELEARSQPDPGVARPAPAEDPTPAAGVAATVAKEALEDSVRAILSGRGPLAVTAVVEESIQRHPGVASLDIRVQLLLSRWIRDGVACKEASGQVALVG